MIGEPRNPPMEETMMMEPSWRAIIWGAVIWISQ